MKNYALILTSVLWLSGCGPEVLKWDEEVLLNTGETIIVHREAIYTLSGSGDNPFKMSMHPRRWDMAIDFDYHGRWYRYDGDANINIFLLAISPQGIPNLIIYPEGFSWDTGNDFNSCADPYYGQLIPDTANGTWSFPKNIEPWLYGLRGNVNGDLSHEKIKKSRLITNAEISLQYSSERSDMKRFSIVDPEHKGSRCGRELSIKVSPRDLGLRK